MDKRITLYHGSPTIVECPRYGGGKPHNDYGPGFYCTRSPEMAREWACAGERDGFANRYEIDLDGLTVCRLNSGRYHILNWLAILLENRTFDVAPGLAVTAKEFILNRFLPEYRDYDILVGYRADDSYFAFAKAFLEGTISLETLSQAMKLGRLGEQTVIRSREAFSRIRFCGAERADWEVWYPRRRERDETARRQYKVLQAESDFRNAVLVADIIRQDWRNDDVRLR